MTWKINPLTIGYRLAGSVFLVLAGQASMLLITGKIYSAIYIVLLAIIGFILINFYESKKIQKPDNFHKIITTLQWAPILFIILVIGYVVIELAFLQYHGVLFK